MRTGSLAVAGVFVVAFAGPVRGQPVPPVVPQLTPPTPFPALPTGEPALAGGTAVSQPLQPVTSPPVVMPLPHLEVEPVPVAPVAPVADVAAETRNPKPGKVLGDWWDSDELLIWWAKPHPVPPLVTGSRGTPPVLGRPGTTLLIGGRAIDNQDIAGYRLTHGWSLNKADTVGFEGRYFFLGTRTVSDFATDITNARFHAIGLPFVNAVTGAEDVLPLARPGESSALVNVFTTTRVQGAEANLVGNLVAVEGVKVHALAGYRYFQANEGLRVEQRWLQRPTPASDFHQTLGMIADQFDAHNEFHGGQVGLLADLHRGPFFVEMTGKVAIGTNTQTVTIDGATHLITAANPVPLFQSFPGGTYALPSNMGRTTRQAFAVVPEGTFKVGLKTGDRGRFYVGYNFLYLSNAVRPGDQIDRVIDPGQIPLVNRGLRFDGPDRPAARVVTTDFWVQGLIIGWEARF